MSRPTESLTGKYLDLREPKFVSERSLASRYHGDAKTVAEEGNDELRQSFKATEKEFPSPEAQIARLTSTVRWSVSHDTLGQASETSGLTPLVFRSIEVPTRPLATQHRTTLIALLQYFESQEVDEAVREQLLDLYQQHRGGGLWGFLRKLGIEHADFEKQTGIAHSRIIQAESRNRLLSYAELHDAVHALYPAKENKHTSRRNRRFAEARTAWSVSKGAQLRERTLEEPLIDFLVALEVHCKEQWGDHLSGVTLTEHCGMHTQFRMPDLLINEIITGELPSWQRITRLAATVLPADRMNDVRDAWLECEGESAKRITLQQAFNHIRTARGITVKDLAEAHGIQSPEQRGKTLKTDNRKQKYRWDREVHNPMDKGGFFAQTSARGTVGCIARTQEEWNALRQLFEEGRRRFYRRSGSELRGEILEMRIAQEWNGVSAEQMHQEFNKERKRAQQSVPPLDRIKRVAWGYVAPESGELCCYRNLIEKLGQTRESTVVSRLRVDDDPLENFEDVSSVTEMISKLAESAKGFKRFDERVNDHAGDVRALHVRSNRLSRIAKGLELPALPLLEHIASSFNVDMPDAVRRDWFARYPAELQTRTRAPLSKPLPRMLTTLIYAGHLSINDFLAERLPGVTTVPYTVNGLENKERIAWKNVSQILSARDVASDSPQWKFAEALFGNGGDVAKALRAVRGDLRDADQDVHPMNLPGMTPEELGIIPSPASKP